MGVIGGASEMCEVIGRHDIDTGMILHDEIRMA